MKILCQFSLDCVGDRKTVLFKTNELRNSSHEVYKKVYIRPDLTKNQMVESKKLVCFSQDHQRIPAREKMDNQERPNNRNQAGNTGTVHVKKCTTRDNKARVVNSPRNLNMYYTNVNNYSTDTTKPGKWHPNIEDQHILSFGMWFHYPQGYLMTNTKGKY